MTQARGVGFDVRHWICDNCLKIYHSREEAEECCELADKGILDREGIL